MKSALLIILQLAATGSDAYFTNRNAQMRGFQEHNPISRPFMGSTSFRVSYFSAEAAGKVAVPILLRKKHHEHMALAFSAAAIADNAEGATYSAAH